LCHHLVVIEVDDEISTFFLDDDAVPVIYEQEDRIGSEEEDLAFFASLLDLGTSLSVQVEDGFFSFELDCSINHDGTMSFAKSDLEALNGLGMVRVEADTGSFIEEVEEGCEGVLSVLEELDRVTFANVEDSQLCNGGTTLTVWRGERIVTNTPRAAPTLVRPCPFSTLSEVDSPVQCCLPPLPKRVLELCGSRLFIPRHTILQSPPKQVVESRPYGDTTTTTVSSSSYTGEGVV
jgi:hypothetical protein